jgi:hypothetical protein
LKYKTRKGVIELLNDQAPVTTKEGLIMMAQYKNAAVANFGDDGPDKD